MVVITPILYGGEIPDQSVLDKVLAACNADDVRPLTDKVEVSAPTIQSYDIELKYYTTAANETAVVENIESSGGLDRPVYILARQQPRSEYQPGLFEKTHTLPGGLRRQPPDRRGSRRYYQTGIHRAERNDGGEVFRQINGIA